MPDIGRFFNVDPLSERYVDWAPYVFSGNIVVHARELEGLEPVVMSGNLVGYNVQQGQGPIAIANDINNPATQQQYKYSTLRNISYTDIVSENPSYFTNVTDKNNINDPGYNNLNINEGDNLSLIKFTAGNLKTELEGQISDLKSTNSNLTKQLDTVSKAHKEVWKNINETTKQNKAMGGDPRSGAAAASYLNTRKERKEAQRLFKEKERLEKRIENNNQKIERKEEAVDKLNKVINE